jgi:hypothetical protein
LLFFAKENKNVWQWVVLQGIIFYHFQGNISAGSEIEIYTHSEREHGKRLILKRNECSA